jgi:hypothetical protein
MKLTTEQQRFWNALKGPEFHAHEMAKDILSVKGRAKRFHQRIDQHLDTLMRLYTDQQVTNILKTWLSVYEMQIDPKQLELFDQLHNRIGSLIIKSPDQIHSY